MVYVQIVWTFSAKFWWWKLFFFPVENSKAGWPTFCKHPVEFVYSFWSWILARRFWCTPLFILYRIVGFSSPPFPIFVSYLQVGVLKHLCFVSHLFLWFNLHCCLSWNFHIGSTTVFVVVLRFICSFYRNCFSAARMIETEDAMSMIISFSFICFRFHNEINFLIFNWGCFIDQLNRLINFACFGSFFPRFLFLQVFRKRLIFWKLLSEFVDRLQLVQQKTSLLLMLFSFLDLARAHLSCSLCKCFFASFSLFVIRTLGIVFLLHFQLYMFFRFFLLSPVWLTLFPASVWPVFQICYSYFIEVCNFSFSDGKSLFFWIV